MKIIIFIWRGMGFLTAIRFGYQGVLYALCGLQLTSGPIENSNYFLSLACFGSFILAMQWAFPWLRS
jgi:hypothetical protein